MLSYIFELVKAALISAIDFAPKKLASLFHAQASVTCQQRQ